MTIVPIGGPHSLQPPRAARAVGAAGFRVPSDSSAETSKTSSTGGITTLSSLLSLQELAPPGERDRRARRRGEGMLSALSRLQRALLGENGAELALHDLAELSSDTELAANPALRDVVAAIRLRAAVEMARADVKFCEQDVHNT